MLFNKVDCSYKYVCTISFRIYILQGRGGSDSPSTPGRRKGGGRGRKKASAHNFDPTPGDPDKPFACERKLKNRPKRRRSIKFFVVLMKFYVTLSS